MTTICDSHFFFFPLILLALVKFLKTKIWEGVLPGVSLHTRIKMDSCQLPGVISLDILSLMSDEYTSRESKRGIKKK